MKKKKASKKSHYDEYYSDGSFELGKIGNDISFRSLLSREDVKEHNKILASEYDSVVKDIDSLVEEIINYLIKCDPLMVLVAATEKYLWMKSPTSSQVILL